jgi:hypothetical protein
VLCLRAAEAVGLEPTTAKPRPVFKTGSSSGRMTSVHSIKLRGLESNQRPPGSEPGVTTSSNYPELLLGHRWCGKARGEGIEPPSPGSKPGSVPLAHPRSYRVPCGNRTRLSSLEGWCLSRSAKGTLSSRRKERESNPQGRFEKARPDSSGVPSPIGLPFPCIKAAAAGIEPASGRLTVAFPYQHRTHRIVSFSQDGRIRTGDLVRPRHAEYQAFPRPEHERPAGVEPALPPWQGSRLPLHHGRLVGSRIVKDQNTIRAPGGTRTLVAALRVRCPRR